MLRLLLASSYKRRVGYERCHVRVGMNSSKHIVSSIRTAAPKSSQKKLMAWLANRINEQLLPVSFTMSARLVAVGWHILEDAGANLDSNPARH